MKKLSALLLAFAMMLTMLSVASADDVQVIRMWSNDQHDQSVIKEKIEAFNATIGKENGIAVEYTVYGSDYYSTLDVAVTSKEGPDIFKCNKIGNYAEAGYILPWEKIPALSTLVERFSSYNAPGYGEFFGQTYSVPIRVTTYGIACNNQIFEENNLELPKTWAEMEEAARVITQNSRGRKYGYALAMGYGSYHYFYVTLANGASVGDEYFNHTTGRYDFTSLSGFLKHVRTFIDDGSMFPGYESMNGDTARAQFSAGNIGMIGVMSSDVTTFKNQFPCDFEWTMIPYPVADAEHYYKEPVGVSMSYVIGESAKGYSDKVALFLNYLYSDEVFLATSDAQVDISILGNEITSQSTATDIDPNWLRFSDMDTFCIKYPNPDSNLFIEGDTYQDVISKILTGIEPNIDGALKALDEKYNAALDAAVANGKVVLSDYIDPDIAEKMQPVK
jgi:multiple sugar transport system substrate-binding protein